MEAVQKKRSFLSNLKLQTYLMITPTVLMIVLFGIYPILYVLFYSFTNYNGMSAPDFVGFTNYIRVLQDSSWWLTVKNTFQIGIVVSLIQVPIALILAIMVSGKLKASGFFRAVLFLPSITSTAIMGIVFYFLFASYNGYVNEILIAANMIENPISWLGDGLMAKGVIVSFLSWHDIGFFMLLFLAALQKIPGDVYESAKIDGANTLQTFMKITVPMLGKMFQIISMLSIVNALKLFDSVKSLTNGGPGSDTEVMTMYIYRYFFENTGIPQQGYASAVSIVATLIVGGVAIIYLLFTKKMNYED
ncbi:carbohydrate ABC transporter permease [Sporanaerobium hydrogeniformans]|uniref:carbohydrate ABC transporter permease n=1 Tax=Sporanaerobium hydrogeniformans TaxID=3072179 RepID=UPI0015D4A964|nr:sugar ABC transporter permease [Sporanaerobium hydrogeniformans]